MALHDRDALGTRAAKAGELKDFLMQRENKTA